MKFNIYDKYILDVLTNKIKNAEKNIKTVIKQDYLDLNKILKEAKIVNEEEASNLIKNGKNFVAGVNFFDTKKTDFFLLSNNGLTIPLSSKNKLIIKDEIALEKELKEKGYLNAMTFVLKSKDEILRNPNSYNNYKIKRDMDTFDIKQRLEDYGRISLKIVPNSYNKIKMVDEENINKILSKTNKLTISLFEKIRKLIPNENLILEDLNFNGFETLKKLTVYKDSIKEILFRLKDIEHTEALYLKINSEGLELKNTLTYEANYKEVNRDLIKVSFDENKIKSIIRTDFLENAEIEKDTEIRIGKPIKTIDEYSNFLKSEEYIRKITSDTKIDIQIGNIPTLGQIYEKEFGMKI